MNQMKLRANMRYNAQVATYIAVEHDDDGSLFFRREDEGYT